jgi:hypothetical protein
MGSPKNLRSARNFLVIRSKVASHPTIEKQIGRCPNFLGTAQKIQLPTLTTTKKLITSW